MKRVFFLAWNWITSACKTFFFILNVEKQHFIWLLLSLKLCASRLRLHLSIMHVMNFPLYLTWYFWNTSGTVISLVGTMFKVVITIIWVISSWLCKHLFFDKRWMSNISATKKVCESAKCNHDLCNLIVSSYHKQTKKIRACVFCNGWKTSAYVASKHCLRSLFVIIIMQIKNQFTELDKQKLDAGLAAVFLSRIKCFSFVTSYYGLINVPSIWVIILNLKSMNWFSRNLT